MATDTELLTESGRCFAAFLFNIPLMKITVGEYNGEMYVKEITGKGLDDMRPLCTLQLLNIAMHDRADWLAQIVYASDEPFAVRGKRMVMHGCLIRHAVRPETDTKEIVVYSNDRRCAMSVPIQYPPYFEMAQDHALREIEALLVRQGALHGGTP